MRIFNTAIYGLEESLIRSGFPMRAETRGIKPSLQRGAKLGHAPSGSGHDCFLKGIVVQADFEMPQYWWQQAKRYHWFDIVSSQSTMHCISKMQLAKMCTKQTDSRCIDIANAYIDLYKRGLCDIDTVLSNIPQGLQLTVGVTTNYLQLKTMYTQRKNHRLIGWNEVFRVWVEGLPYVKELGVIS